MIVESLFSTIDRGKSGMNIGISTGLPKIPVLSIEFLLSRILNT